MCGIVNKISNDFSDVEIGGNVYSSIFCEYERVIMQSLITSFGLDSIIRDQHGGDVDTILNVRNVGIDPSMVYKDKDNRTAYEKRNSYDYGRYHRDTRFTKKTHEARKEFQATGQTIDNEYRDGSKIGWYGHTKSIPNEKKAELDHIVECKAINDDPGRVLSGLSGIDLANAEENLAWTDKSLNASMGSWARAQNEKYKKEHGYDAPIDFVDIKAYVKAHPELDEKTKANMIRHYEKARKAYERKIKHSYYTSRKFISDTANAAVKTGVLMGLREALGLVLSEVWFSIKERITTAKTNGEKLFQSISKGVEIGINRAKVKYKDVLGKFKDGTLAGILSSLTTTLINTFATTAKNTVKILRQSWASLVEATKILLYNPDALPFGERIRAAAKVIATGASVVVGSLVGDLIANSGIGTIPLVGGILQTFCSTLVSGVLSCTLLYVLDYDSRIARIIEILNSIKTADDNVNYYLLEAKLLEEYAAKLYDIDTAKFCSEVDGFYNVLKDIDKDMSEAQLNKCLKLTIKENGLQLPYGNHTSLCSFMHSQGHLHFE